MSLRMEKKWPILKHPPVIIAIFQIKFTDIDLGIFISLDKKIREVFPFREDKFESNINMPGTPRPGISIVHAKTDTKITTYTYYTENRKQRLTIEKDSISYSFEGEYSGWNSFKSMVTTCAELLKEQLTNMGIKRTSIRFINKFNFDSFDNPLDYFRTTISSEDDYQPEGLITMFSYKVGQLFSDINVRTIVNHAVEKISDNNFEYYLDIDVLDHNLYTFDFEILNHKLEEIRDIKNTLFFNIVKEKTIELCN